MKRRFLMGAGVISLAILVTLVVWQGSFSFGMYGPASAEQTYLLWAVSTLIFILMVTLSFMLVRTGVKLYIERRSNQEGSLIKSKLVVGALALSIMPVVFLVLFSISVLNHNLNKWFSRPANTILHNLADVSSTFERETRLRAESQARWLAASPEVARALQSGAPPAGLVTAVCGQTGPAEVILEKHDGSRTTICPAPRESAGNARWVAARVPVATSDGVPADLVVRAWMPLDLAATQGVIDREVREYDKLAASRKETRLAYILLLLLISLFILFVATWIALILARQISRPISALVEAAGQLRRGNLSYRVQERGIDELGTLIRAFNDMSQELEANEGELERRHRFTEAILESIPTAVISLSAAGQIQRVNRVLAQMFGADKAAGARRLEDLFPPEDAREIYYLTNRARRTGSAFSQLELKGDRGILHLAVTVSALAGRHTSGFVVVLEDTSELLRAQKAAAWHEVARRIAHEMKNPLTPISLSAERIARQLDRAPGELVSRSPDFFRILQDCSGIIAAEVESVKVLVDEFSQFARFPATQPVPSSLNEVVESALAVFNGRLDGIDVDRQLTPDLPPVLVDREQIKRVVVNLVDNAAEAMQDAPLRRLFVGTQLSSPDTIELVVADTGHGISAEDREKLFLPYFSTKERGTGLGLAIVHHILADHGAQIRMEDNTPAGARFIVEFTTMREPAPEPSAVESHA